MFLKIKNINHGRILNLEVVYQSDSFDDSNGEPKDCNDSNGVPKEFNGSNGEPQDL